MGSWLVIGILLILATAAMVTSIWKAQEEATAAAPSRPAQRLRFMAREFTVVALSDAFEPEMAPLWEPQIEVLRLIGDAGSSGLDYDLLRPAHQQLAERYPELYEGSDLESWLEAMERAELIAWGESTVTLTPAGTAFLKCRLPVTV